jgi:hypothetical protein
MPAPSNNVYSIFSAARAAASRVRNWTLGVSDDELFDDGQSGSNTIVEFKQTSENLMRISVTCDGNTCTGFAATPAMADELMLMLDNLINDAENN